MRDTKFITMEYIEFKKIIKHIKKNPSPAASATKNSPTKVLKLFLRWAKIFYSISRAVIAVISC